MQASLKEQTGYNVQYYFLFVAASSERANCILGADGTNYALTSCLQKGDDFLRAYANHVKRKQDNFATCE